MSDLISRDALKEAIGKVYACDWDDIEKNFHFAEAVNSLPSAEPERTAKVRDWSEDGFGHYRCDKCGFVLESDYVYCPSCGARLEWE